MTLFRRTIYFLGKCAGICIDGAAAGAGKKSKEAKPVQDKAPSARWAYCFLHGEALAARNLSEELPMTNLIM